MGEAKKRAKLAVKPMTVDTLSGRFMCAGIQKLGNPEWSTNFLCRISVQHWTIGSP